MDASRIEQGLAWVMISALLFDLDGLLADTESLQMRAYQAALLENGLVLSDDDYAEHWIRAGRNLSGYLGERQQVFPLTVLRKRKAELYHALLERSLCEMPGASQALKRLHGTMPLALASSANTAAVTFVLERLGFTAYFSAVVSAGDVRALKPEPDLFLLAAKQLGVPPQDCVVIEDAEKGILAAHRAGMRSIAIPNRHTARNDFSLATCVLDSLHALPETLSGWDRVHAGIAPRPSG